MNDLKKIKKAGKIAAEALTFAKSLIKENVPVSEIVNKVEGKIFSLGAKPAFPVNISINEIAAHFIPLAEIKLKESDLVKIDVGVHVDGFIGDTACTIEVKTNKNKKLIMAVEEALEKALSIIKIGVKVSEIGREIENVIKDYGFEPIRNLSGHSITQHTLHSGITIPNFDNKDNTILKEGDIIAIEPFATTGIGLVGEGKPSGIYRLEGKKPVRDVNTKVILNFIENEYKTLPFSKNWLIKKFNLFRTNIALNTLEREKIIHQYPQLVEKSKNLVSQAEHTILVAKEPIILTKL